MTADHVRSEPGCTWIVGLPALIAILCQFAAGPAAALEWEYEGVDINFDTTLSQGVSVRASERDPATIGTANGGTAHSVNHDDGTLNYDDGKISQNVSRFTSDLNIDGGALSAFFRVTGFVDWEQRNGTRERTPLTKEALEIVGQDLELLDAYVTGNFNVGEAPAQLRVGQQVLSWGESTFIPNGINVINPIDVARFRTPGAELRNALKPIPMISGSVSTSESITVEAFYQLRWKEVETDPPGTFFSTNDFVGAGGSRVFLGFGEFSDLGTSFGPVLGPAINQDLIDAALPGQPPFDPNFLGVSRGPDDTPSDTGQFGVAMRMFAEKLNGAEFGLYYMKYNSRLPIVSARTGTTAGVNLANASAVTIATGANTNLATGSLAASAKLGGLVGVDRYAQTANYFIEYPEAIDLIGASFNSEVGNTGWALQGEYSFKNDLALQVDDVELLFAALTPLSTSNPTFYKQFADNQLGTFGTDTIIHGFIERDVSQLQATATKVLGPTFGANTGVFVVEVGGTYVHSMPKQSSKRLNAAGTDTSGNSQQAAAGGAHEGKPAEPSSAFPTAASWGYRMAAQLTYNNAIEAINLSPRIQWAHDVQGISPQPAGPFREGRKAFSVGLKATYLQEWEADVSYTNFFGAGKYNLLNDRDFFALTVKYSF